MANGASERDKPQTENSEQPGESAPTMHNTSPYVRTVVFLHNFRDSAKDTVDSWKERGLADRLQDGWNSTRNKVSARTRSFFTHPENVPCQYIPQKYNYVFRPKSRWEMVLLSGTVCGIEFCYAAETAFVTPILLSLGLSIKFVTMMWCLSPLVGLLLTPILGSMSDTCKSKLGRRRPFIILYSIGILMGLILVPNGHHIGLALGDRNHNHHQMDQNLIVMLNGTSLNDVKMSQVGNLDDKVISNSTELFNELDQKDILSSNQEPRYQLQTDLKSKQWNTEQKQRSMDMEDVFPNLRFSSSKSKLVTNSDEEEKQNQRDEFSSLIDLELEDNKTELDQVENSRGDVSKIFNKAVFSNRKSDENDVFSQLKNNLLDMRINKNVENEFLDSQTTSKPTSEENVLNFNNIPEYLASKSTLLPSSKGISKRSHDEEDIFTSSMSDRIRFAKTTKLKDTTNENVVSESKSDSNLPFQDSDDEFSHLIDMEYNSSPEDLSTKLETQTKSRNIVRKSSRTNDVQDTFPARRMDGNVYDSNDLLNLQTGIFKTTDSRNSERETEDDQKELKQSNTSEEQNNPSHDSDSRYIQTWSIVFTVIGTVLLDFCSDACQSPSRTYLLDVSLPSDHAAGLSTFTVMAGLGGSIGYMMGAVHWETTFLGRLLGSQVHAVFLIVTIIFIICLLTTVCSFPEIPLSVFGDPKMYHEYQEKIQDESSKEAGNEMDIINVKARRYGSTDSSIGIRMSISKADVVDETNFNYTEPEKETKFTNNDVCEIDPSRQKDAESKECQKLPDGMELNVPDQLESCTEPTLKDFLKSIVQMPSSLRILCLTNLFCWMSLVCYSLYFTDFVGECVFGGDPQAPEDSQSFSLYQEGVQFGCWGMALYSISCSVYSFFIEALVKKIGAKRTYVGGQLVYSCGMVIMAFARHKIAVILLSPTAGVMYSTLFTMPYLLIAHYHSTKQFSNDQEGAEVNVRGIGTDVAAVSSMVFLSQFVLSLSMGSIVEAIGSNVVPVCAAALLSACGALSATQVTYLNI